MFIYNQNFENCNENEMLSSNLRALNDQQRHDYILQAFILKQQHLNAKRKHKRDIDIIREHHRFLWDDGNDDNDDNDNQGNDNDQNSGRNATNDNDVSISNETWAINLARRYYDKLFKEYSIADLTRYKENKIALRWRTEAEVIAGIGQFQCGSRKCDGRDDLRTWEVNFAYREHGEYKNALVKLRLCPEHSDQLNYTSKKREVKRLKHAARQESKKRKKRSNSKGKRPVLERVDSVNEDNDKDDHGVPKEVQLLSENVIEDKGSDTDNNSVDNDSDIWNKKLDVDVEPPSRETEFERYLEDLLL